MIFTYLVHFDGMIQQERFTVKSFEEYQHVLANLVYKHGKMFEWCIRVY